MSAKRFDKNIYPDEIFMDSKNVSGFNTQQFEGRLEKPVSKKTFWGISISFLLIGIIFLGQLFNLQILKADEFIRRGENNSLRLIPLFQERGIIYDRNGKELAWNGPSFRIISKNKEGKDIVVKTFYDWDEALNYVSEDKSLEIENFSSRFYIEKPGFSHILGYLSYPSKKDLQSNSPVLREAMIGKSGVEKQYEEKLKGEIGTKLIETDSSGKITSEGVQKKSVQGENITLTIDSDLQSKLFEIINSTLKDRGFQGGAGIVIDVENGEILSLVSCPEYDSQILSRGSPDSKIREFFTNTKMPFLNRVVSGLYAPGSIVKPLIAISALNEGIISPEKQIYSSGSISLPNPYFPELKSVFNDWKAHGWVDMRRALAVSSDVYFYEVGGGFEDVRGLGIKKIEEYAYRFGLGALTGIDIEGEKVGLIPSPEWKSANIKDDTMWRIGDTYHTSIGQGYFQVTPIQMAVFASTFANKGEIVRPHIVKTSENSDDFKNVNIPESYFNVVQEGMRMSATEGTASALNIPQVKIAAKTGTAQVGISKSYVNSWVIGFFPYEKPKYAFAIVMDRGPAKNLIGAPYVSRQFFDWMSLNTPEYLVK